MGLTYLPTYSPFLNKHSLGSYYVLLTMLEVGDEHFLKEHTV